MKSHAPAEFWQHDDRPPRHAQKLADRTFEFFKKDPLYPALHFKRLRDDIWSVRVGNHYRAMAKQRADGLDVVLDWHTRRIQQAGQESLKPSHKADWHVNASHIAPVRSRRTTR